MVRRTGMNLEKHLNVRFVHESEKLNSNNLVKSYSELEGEFATPYLQVTSRKRSVTDCIPSKFQWMFQWIVNGCLVGFLSKH